MTIKNIPVGYKDSPLGIIPQEWEVKKLGDLCNSINSGGSKQRNDNGKYPIYGSTGLIGYSNVCIYDIPQILVARVGAHAGYVYCVDGNYDVSDNTLILNLKSTYHFDFAYNQLLHCNLNKYVFGSGQPLVTAGQLKLLKLPLPPLAEQEKIAEILSTWDKAIDKQTQLIEKLELRKKGLMQQLLTGKKRLPGFTGEWKKVKFSLLIDKISNGYTYDVNSGGNIPITRIETISKGFIDYMRVGYTQYVDTLENYRLLKGDILFSHINSIIHIGKVAIYKGEKELYHGMNLLLIRAKQTMNKNYLYYFLSSSIARKKVRSFAKQAVNQASVNTEELKKWILNIPSLQEQTAIANILSSCDEEIRLAQDKLAAIKEQKKGLMQVLLTGKKRVKI